MWSAGAQSLNGEQLQHVKEAALLHLLSAAYKHVPPARTLARTHTRMLASHSFRCQSSSQGVFTKRPSFEGWQVWGGGGSSLNTHRHPLFLIVVVFFGGGAFGVLSSLLVFVFPLFFQPRVVWE